MGYIYRYASTDWSFGDESHTMGNGIYAMVVYDVENFVLLWVVFKCFVGRYGIHT
jgi:hypothetical protein